MIHPFDFMEYVIKPTLKELSAYDARIDSEPARALLLGIAAQESSLGYRLKQENNGPALGVFQMEPETHHSLWDNFISYRSDLWNVLSRMAGKVADNEEIPPEEMITNLKYACAMARLRLWVSPFPLPTEANNIKALGEYWKQHYNTPLGKGKVSDFIANYPD